MTGRVSDFERTGDVRTAPVPNGAVIAGKYVVGEELGVGGMGVVVAARDELLDRKVAIKFLLPSLATNASAVSRFKREARLASRITSPHVVTLLEIDELADGIPFFVMEYLEGRDLRKVLADGGPLVAADAVDYVLQAVEAVAEGHLRGIVHRDLKPSNLFLTQRAGGEPLVKVLDFGIAKALEVDPTVDPTLTGSSDTRLGSPAYSSPEQLDGPHDVDARTDVWALGVTLYELLCGRLPFGGRSAIDLVVGIKSGQPSPLRHHHPRLELPEGLERVVLYCLAKDRRDRFQTATELAEALASFGSDEARVSLRRIRGLRSTPPPPLNAVRVSEPTLAVSPPSAPPASQHGGAEKPRATAAARRFAFVGVVLLGLVGLAALISWRPKVDGSPVVAATSTLETSPAKGAALTTVPERDVPVAVTEMSTSVPRAPAITSVRAKLLAAKKPPERSAPARSQEVAPVVSAVATAAATDAPSSAEPSATPPPVVGGRSPKIERLIERRH